MLYLISVYIKLSLSRREKFIKFEAFKTPVILTVAFWCMALYSLPDGCKRFGEYIDSIPKIKIAILIILLKNEHNIIYTWILKQQLLTSRKFMTQLGNISDIHVEFGMLLC